MKQPLAAPAFSGQFESFFARLERVRRIAGTDQPALKAERIQENLRRFPGWQPCPGAAGLCRGYRFPAPADASAFVVFLAGLLGNLGLVPKVELVGSLLAVHIATLGKPGEVSELDFEIVALVEGREE